MTDIKVGRGDLAAKARSAKKHLREVVEESRKRDASPKEAAPLRDTLYVVVEERIKPSGDGFYSRAFVVSTHPPSVKPFKGDKARDEPQALRLLRGCFVDQLVKGRVCGGAEARARARTANIEVMDRLVEQPEVPKITGVVGADVSADND